MRENGMQERRWWRVVRMRLRTIFKRRRVDQELDKELRFHVEQQAQENMARGMSPVEAREAALRRLGGVTQIQENCRDMRRTNYLEDFWQDLRYAARTLAKSPGFALVMVLTLALSIGANSAIFSVIDGVLLKRLPYPEQNRIVRIFYSNQDYPHFPMNPFDFRDFRSRNHSFEGMAAFTHHDLQLSGAGQPGQAGQPVRLSAFLVTSGYFRVLGLQPERGREFEEKDELPGNDKVVIISDRLWRREFAAAPDIIGRKVILDNEPFTVVGVMPPRTDHPGNEYQPVAHGDTVDAWWPFTFEGNPAQRGAHYVEGIARLKPGVMAEQGQSELNTLMAQITREYPGMYAGWKILAIPVYRTIVGPSQRMLLVLLGAVALVLLIACANAANLMLARAASRQREIAVRSALGAPRSRLIRQMLTESIFVALLGGGLGAALAAGFVKVLVSLLPAGFPRADTIHLNSTVFAFTFLIAVGTGLLFGIVPALQTSRTDLQLNLREGGRGATGSVRHHRLRSALVMTEVSLACVLLVGAGLMLRSFVNLLRADPGFQPEHVLTASLALPEADYKTGDVVSHFYDRLLNNLSSAPGVSTAGAGSDVPWTGYDDNAGFNIEGKTSPPGEGFHARYHLASPDYFRALGIPLVRGRYFTAADNKDAHATLIINDALARLYWPGMDPIGTRITFEDNPKEKDWITIVGIVGDVKDKADSSHAESAFWWPMLQQPFTFRKMSIAVRAKGDASELAGIVREEVHKLDPTLAVADVRLMDNIADASVSTPRFTFFLIGLFAGLAIVLAAIGIYGVISYSVTQRAHELGLRVALGAQRWDVLRLVLSEGMRLAMGGVFLGVICALALARALRSLIYEVSAADPLTFSLVSLLVVAVALVACYFPARRATQADPVVALRSE